MLIVSVFIGLNLTERPVDRVAGYDEHEFGFPNTVYSTHNKRYKGVWFQSRIFLNAIFLISSLQVCYVFLERRPRSFRLHWCTILMLAGVAAALAVLDCTSAIRTPYTLVVYEYGFPQPAIIWTKYQYLDLVSKTETKWSYSWLAITSNVLAHMALITIVAINLEIYFRHRRRPN